MIYNDCNEAVTYRPKLYCTNYPSIRLRRVGPIPEQYMTGYNETIGVSMEID